MGSTIHYMCIIYMKNKESSVPPKNVTKIMCCVQDC